MSRAARVAISLVDLGFGDAGKGTTIDALTHRTGSRLAVRFNGGPQAGHNVVLPDGRHHTFSQFASNAFHEDAQTLLADAVLIEPYALANEASHLQRVGIRDPLARLAVHRRCRVISPAHQASNQLLELARSIDAHGTCGRGVGECAGDDLAMPELTLIAADLTDRQKVRRLLLQQRDLKRDKLTDAVRTFSRHPAAGLAMEVLDGDAWLEPAIDTYASVSHRLRLVDDADVRAMFVETSTILFEGAQGVLLDEDWGFHPHTTWSRTTFANAETLLDACGFDGQRVRWGVTRCYHTRHGAGPLVSEVAAGECSFDEPHNTAEGWQGQFRVGRFDAVATEYALRCVGPVDGVVITHLDRLAELPQGLCTGYRLPGRNEPLEALPLIDSKDLHARERLTRQLLSARPSIETPVQSGNFVAWFQERFKVEVVLQSFGPTYQEKLWLA